MLLAPQQLERNTSQSMIRLVLVLKVTTTNFPYLDTTRTLQPWETLFPTTAECRFPRGIRTTVVPLVAANLKQVKIRERGTVCSHVIPDEHSLIF